MRVALISDIHGNSVALDAVLGDCVGAEVEAYWILGDMVALGPDPIGVLRRLVALPNVRCVRGNTDRYVALGDRPFPSLADVEMDTTLLPRFVEVSETFSWTHGAVASAGWLPWLKGLPLEIRHILPDGTRMLGVHSSPGRDDGDGLRATASEDELAQLLRGCDADLVVSGHTHRPFNRRMGPWDIANLGCVSLSPTENKRAGYVILNASPGGYELEYRTVEYDIEQVIRELEKLDHPGRRFIIKHLLADRAQMPNQALEPTPVVNLLR